MLPMVNTPRVLTMAHTSLGTQTTVKLWGATAT